MGIEQKKNAGTPRVTMRAVVQQRYGPPTVLELRELEVPEPSPTEVLVKIAAAAIHPGDYFVMTGEPHLVRLAFGIRRPRRGIPGRDLAGGVNAVGNDATAFRPGQQVFGWSPLGTLAQYAGVPQGNLAPIPANLSMAEATAVPTSGLAALQALRRIANVQPGQRVLITGASGGVGSFAVQIATALGAEVTGVCSTRNLKLIRSLGAEHVVDYAQSDFTGGTKRYDVSFDNVEYRPLAVVRRALTPTGTLTPNSGRGSRWIGPVGRILKARLLSAFSTQHLKPFVSRENQQDLLTLAALLGTGQITPVIDRTDPLDDAAAALDYIAAGHTRGKVVITS